MTPSKVRVAVSRLRTARLRVRQASNRLALSSTPRHSRAPIETFDCCAHRQTRFLASSVAVPPAVETVSDRIRALASAGEIRSDPAQVQVAKRLSRLQKALRDYDNAPLVEYAKKMLEYRISLRERQQRETEREEREWLERAKNGDNEPAPNGKPSDSDKGGDGSDARVSVPSPPAPPPVRMPRGLYIHGQVGTGKSMLMDLFYDTLLRQSRSPSARAEDDSSATTQPPTTTANTKVARVHFHSFLSDIHNRIHTLKQHDLAQLGRSFKIDTREETNPIYRVASQVASEVSVLCLDEFQVTDIADALILSQFFSALSRQGVIVVATSNRPPKDLYEGGLNRSYFLPFIDLLEKHCIVHSMESNVDYRMIDRRPNGDSSSTAADVSQLLPKSFFGTSDHSARVVRSLLSMATHPCCDTLSTTAHVGNTTSSPTSQQLRVGRHRTLHVPTVYEELSLAEFCFDELCDRDLGAADYRAIASTYSCIYVKNVPLLTLEAHNQARRFITLVDELYEGRCGLICSTAVADDYSNETVTPLHMFQQRSGTLADNDGQLDGDEDLLWMDAATTRGGAPVGALASVVELEFAFQRAASRIHEMCSRSWWERCGIIPSNGRT